MILPEQICYQSLSPIGRDFSHDETLDVPTQVELLIKQATSHENLCQCYIGWSVYLTHIFSFRVSQSSDAWLQESTLNRTEVMTLNV